ncbi:MAG: ATP-binding cassette domain-containing protein [Verrucomicrobiales bacterium]|nr:ATP-binding cassette domain-containing protein [Verrucomicrobiales bacterium]
MPMKPSRNRAEPADETQEIVVAVRGLTKVFNDFWGKEKAVAINGVDFEIRRGEVFGLLGPNGSGKSTTIKILLGLLQPTRGFVEVLGRSPTDVPVKERVGYLPEEAYLYPFLDATETLEFFGNLFSIPTSERVRRTEQLLEMVGLSGAKRRRAGEFSKGMQRRLGLAQALVNDPDLVILDEPTAGLDPTGCREVKDLIRSLAARGKTVILSSHLLADVEDVCNRVVIYYGGRIQAAGVMKELLATPDVLRLTTPALSRELMAEVLSLLRREIQPDRIQVEVPTKNLETYFLEVVQRARESAQETSGASSGNRVADYLAAPNPPAHSRDRILERLSSAPIPASTEPAPALESAPLPAAALQRLENLTQVKEDQVAPTQPESPTSNPSAATNNAQQLNQANTKLSRLLKPSDQPKPGT